MPVTLRTAMFLLFALSGFSGLVYESIWTQYLKLFLGHAAYAQTLVLAIFMGGMALGSWLCSRCSTRCKKLLLGYALAEGLIGLFALVFHTAFDQLVQFSYTSVIPNLSAPATIDAFKWALSALLILPQSILLGTTFPLMSSALLRMFPQSPGRSVAMLYFTNSIGAAIGVLTSGFVLIRLAGLPGTIRVAGVINIALAVVVWRMAKNHHVEPCKGTVPRETEEGRPGAGWYRFLLAASLLTGLSSFIYEMGWIRMLCLVLGSSTHAFELMLSAFIFGLACGALWIQSRLDRIGNTYRFLGMVQIVMGVLALATLPLYGNTFQVMKWLLTSLEKTETGYMLFNLSSHAIALAVMLPATFCAGMTLPLITYMLIKEGHGERSVGAVYAANTVGAIIGVFLAIHLGMPLLGLKGVMTLGAELDMAVGLMLLCQTKAKHNRHLIPIGMTLACMGGALVNLLFVELDPYKMASGVYRNGSLLDRDNYRVMHHKDGKTATVSLSWSRNGMMSIRTNGKPDAAINMLPGRSATPDESTMILSAVIPMALHPQARTVAAIGLGSGLTTHTMLCNSWLEQVDTVEIEQEMVEAAKNFGYRVYLTYADPRSKIHIDDAKTFFSSHKKMYDIIVSEPSNPWVSGVAGLFSEEFYRLINRHLGKNGLFVQWLPLYEMDMNLVVSVLKAVSANFSDFVVYAPNDAEVIIIAGNGSNLAGVNSQLLTMPEISAALRRINIESVQDIEIRRIGDKKIFAGLLETFPVRANSDYYPILDQNAARVRFLKIYALELQRFTHDPLPALEMLTGAGPSWKTTNITPSPFYHKSKAAFEAMALRDYFLHGEFGATYRDIPVEIRRQVQLLRQVFHQPGYAADPATRMGTLAEIAQVIPYLRPGELEAVWETLETGGGAAALTTEERALISLLKAVGKRDAQAMASAAVRLLHYRQQLPPEATDYAVAAGMLGFLAQGNQKAARKLCSVHRPETFEGSGQGLLFRLLAAHSASS